MHSHQQSNHVFEIALVLLGILSASEMMNFASFFGPKTALEFGTIPFIIMILLWIIKEVYMNSLPTEALFLLLELSWLIWSLTLAYHLLFLYINVYSTTPQIAFLESILTGLIVYGIIIGGYYLENRPDTRYYDDHKWLVTRSVLMTLVGGIIVYLIFSAIPQ